MTTAHEQALQYALAWHLRTWPDTDTITAEDVLNHIREADWDDDIIYSMGDEGDESTEIVIESEFAMLSGEQLADRIESLAQMLIDFANEQVVRQQEPKVCERCGNTGRWSLRWDGSDIDMGACPDCEIGQAIAKDEVN